MARRQPPPLHAAAGQGGAPRQLEPRLSSGSLAALRDLLRERGDSLTFAQLSEPLLEDLAVGWLEGRPFAEAASALLSRTDGISPQGRDRQLAGRAALTLAARRGADVRLVTQPENVYLLGDPEEDEGDPEAERAYSRRQREYEELSRIAVQMAPEEFVSAAARAFRAAREGVEPGEDRIAGSHPLALLGLTLPPGLLAWFRRSFDPDRADALAWKFVLVSRALARHRSAMAETGVLPPGADAPVPQQLLTALLALDLGELARTAVLEP
jgi:hypothetical protein